MQYDYIPSQDPVYDYPFHVLASTNLSPEQQAQMNYASTKPCSSLTLVDTQFEENTAEGGGGVIYTNSPQGFHTFCDGTCTSARV